MASTLPSNLHAEIALDRGRLSHESPERSGARSISQARAMAADPPRARVQSLHGVIVETHAGPGYGSSGQRGYGHSPLRAQSGMIMSEADMYEGRGGNGTLSGADLAAALDDEDGWDDEDDAEAIRMPHGGQGYDERDMAASGDYSQGQHAQQQQQQQRPFAPRQSSLNTPAPQQQGGTDAYPRSILVDRTDTLTPPVRTSSGSAPLSAPAHQQSFSNKPRFALTDGGPVVGPPSPGGSEYSFDHGQAGGHPAIRRAVSDSYPQMHSEPSSPGLGVTPPMRRGGAQTQPSTPKYNTFEEMGIQGNQAEKDKDCVIM